MRKRNPYLDFAIPSFIATAALTYSVLRSLHTAGTLTAWFVAVNIVSFVLFVYDKAAAGRNKTRVPELDLLAITLLGGWLGAGTAMVLRRHKTSKTGFLILYGLCVIGSLLLGSVVYRWYHPG